MDRGAWWATVHGLAKSQTRLSNFIFTFNLMVTYYNSNWKLKCYFNSVHLVLILIIYGCKAVYGIFFFFKLCFFFFNISFPTWLEVFLFRPVSLLPQVCLYFRSVF